MDNSEGPRYTRRADRAGEKTYKDVVGLVLLMANIIVRDANGTSRVLKNKPFEYEAVLQQTIAELPSVVPLESILDEPIVHVTIGTEWPAGSGRVDIVLLGSDGLLTIIETKLARNPEARRQVVAQVLEYAAYLSEMALLDVERLSEAFFEHEDCPAEFQGWTFDEALHFLRGDDDEEEGTRELRGKIEQNLHDGRLRLIVAVDEVGEQAQKIVTFLNSHSTFDIYLLQVSEFNDNDGKSILVPTLHGYAPKVSRSPSTKQWTWDMLESAWPSEAVERARALTHRLAQLSPDWQPEIGLHPSWTTVRCLGRAVCGVQLYKKKPPELWLLLTETPPDGLPEDVTARQSKSYLYVSGNVESVSDDTLRSLCAAALAQAGINPSNP